MSELELYCPNCGLEKKKTKLIFEINAESTPDEKNVHSTSCYRCPECKRVYNIEPLAELIAGC